MHPSGRAQRKRALPYLHTKAAELLFRHKVISLLKEEGLLAHERIQLLLSWQQHTGFSAHNAVTVEPEDPDAVERLARCLLRPPLSLERMSFDVQQGVVHYRRKWPGRLSTAVETFDPLDFLARLLMHAPEPRLHTIRYPGHYSNVARGAIRSVASTGGTSTTATLGLQGEGSFVWRVAAYGDEGVKGPWSDPRQFRVSAAKGSEDLAAQAGAES